VSGAAKSVVNHWYDYEQELLKPEEERTTLIGISDTPILSHTVNVVKSLLEKIEILSLSLKTIEERNQILEKHARKQENDFNEQKDKILLSLKTIETLQQRNQILEDHTRKQEKDFNNLSIEFNEYKKMTEDRFNSLINLLNNNSNK